MPSTEVSISEAELLACCGSREWARRMWAMQPFGGAAEMLATADRVWRQLDRVDWLEAFAAHPRIGEKTSDARASREQSGVRDAAETTLERLASGNREYEARFGYIYIVCASGKSAEEMLAILEARLRNPADEEIRVAAEQQRQITALRLRKWLDRR